MNEPSDTHLPTAKDINVFGSLDEQSAQRNFIGKSLEQAEEMLRENFSGYTEDLTHMGVIAFRFYVQAASNCIRNYPSACDDLSFMSFLSTLEHRLEYQGDELRPIAAQLADICGYILAQHDADISGYISKEPPPVERVGDLRPRYRHLLQTFSQPEKCGMKNGRKNEKNGVKQP